MRIFGRALRAELNPDGPGRLRRRAAGRGPRMPGAGDPPGEGCRARRRALLRARGVAERRARRCARAGARRARGRARWRSRVRGTWRARRRGGRAAPGRGLLGADASSACCMDRSARTGRCRGCSRCLDVAYVGVGRAGSSGARAWTRSSFEGSCWRARACRRSTTGALCTSAGPMRADVVLAGARCSGCRVRRARRGLGSSVGIVRVGEADALGGCARDGLRARCARDRRGERERARDRVLGARQRPPRSGHRGR